MSWKVNFFQTARGEFPVREFIDKQEKTTQTKIDGYMNLLADHGPFLKPPYVKKLQGKLYELRVSGEVTVRIFYTIFKNEYYLLRAFKKKSQKTPQNELKTALDRMKQLI